MEERRENYRICQDCTVQPMMCGIVSEDGPCVRYISTDSWEVEQLVEKCNRYQLSVLHLADIVADFCHP